MPGTSRVVDTWKHVGTWQSSAVQIAPRWVLSADHSSIPPGQLFRNARGQATVVQQYRPTVGYDEAGSNGIDLTLHYLDAPINATGTFPKLLDAYVDTALNDSLPGWLFNVGYGFAGTTPPAPNTPTVAWSTAYGMASPGSAAKVIGTGGDSGGGQFWFPTPTSAPVLAGILTQGVETGIGFQQPVGGVKPTTGERIRDFMDAAFAARAGEPGATPPQFTTIQEQVGPLSALKPAAVSEAWADSIGATSMRVDWFNPVSDQVPRTGVKILLNGVVKATAPADATHVTVSGLKWFTLYKVRVVGTGPGGDAVSIAADDSFDAFTFW